MLIIATKGYTMWHPFIMIVKQYTHIENTREEISQERHCLKLLKNRFP